MEIPEVTKLSFEVAAWLMVIGMVGTCARAIVIDNRKQHLQLREFITMNVQRLIEGMNTVTNDLAARLAARDAKIKDAGELTPALEAEGLAIIARLNGLASDPADPIPAEPTAAEAPATAEAPAESAPADAEKTQG